MSEAPLSVRKRDLNNAGKVALFFFALGAYLFFGLGPFVDWVMALICFIPFKLTCINYYVQRKRLRTYEQRLLETSDS